MRTPWRFLLLVSAIAAAACGGSRATPRAPSATQAGPTPATSAQALFEAGRYDDVLATVPSGAAPRDEWFAVSSAARLDRSAEVAVLLDELATTPDPAWAAVARLMRARLAGDQAGLATALEASQSFTTHPIVQLERGRALALRGAPDQAAAAFDRAIELDPRLAYAYYYAALAYNALEQTAMTSVRLETFLRLAPDAPERPEVRSILGTLGR